MDFLGFTLKRFVWKTKVCDHQVENQRVDPRTRSKIGENVPKGRKLKPERQDHGGWQLARL